MEPCTYFSTSKYTQKKIWKIKAHR